MPPRSLGSFRVQNLRNASLQTRVLSTSNVYQRYQVQYTKYSAILKLSIDEDNFYLLLVQTRRRYNCAFARSRIHAFALLCVRALACSDSWAFKNIYEQSHIRKRWKPTKIHTPWWGMDQVNQGAGSQRV